MTGMLAAVQSAAAVEDPRARGPTASCAALDGERDTDLWLWLVSAAVSVAVGLRFFGHYYMQLVPPLALLAAGALVARQPEVGHAAVVAFAVVSALGFSAAGYFCHPFVPEPNVRVGGALPRHHHQPRRPDLRVGQRAGDLLGVRAPPGDTLPDVDVPHRQLSGPPARRRQHRRRHRGRLGGLLRGLQGRTRRSTSSTRHRRRCAARSTTRSPSFPRLEHIVDKQYRYVVTIDGIDIYRRK